MTKFKIPIRERLGYIVDSALTGAVLAFSLEEVFSGDTERGIILGLIGLMRIRFAILETRVAVLDAELAKTDAAAIRDELRRGNADLTISDSDVIRNEIDLDHERRR